MDLKYGALVSNYNLMGLNSHFNKISDRFKLLDQTQGHWLTSLKQVSTSEIDFVVINIGIEAVSDEFVKALNGQKFNIDLISTQVQEFGVIISDIAKEKTVVLFSWVVNNFIRKNILLDMQKPWGAGYLINYVNNLLYEVLSDSGCLLIDTNAQVHPDFSDKLYFAAKQPYTLKSIARFSEVLNESLSRLVLTQRKVLVLDLDNTLWGGVVGDDGYENLELGGHSHVGEAYRAFQEEILTLKQRGILLAIVSKNTEAIALDAIQNHPEMVLDLNDFVCYRINWLDKAKNILDISKELNLGLQSFVFLDDSKIERARVQESLSEVYVPELPSDVSNYREFLRSLQCFDTTVITTEDKERTQQYFQSKCRTELMLKSASMEDWLNSLSLNIQIKTVGSDFKRAFQLLNKTNQMNLTTRRLSESEFHAWCSQPNAHICLLDISDRFGSLGVTGILSVYIDSTTAHIVDFVLSCRAMGRNVEAFMEVLACKIASLNGAERVIAKLVPTAKNAPMKSFLDNSRAVSGCDDYTWSDLSSYQFPASIVSNANEFLNANSKVI